MSRKPPRLGFVAMTGCKPSVCGVCSKLRRKVLSYAMGFDYAFAVEDFEEWRKAHTVCDVFPVRKDVRLSVMICTSCAGRLSSKLDTAIEKFLKE